MPGGVECSNWALGTVRELLFEKKQMITLCSSGAHLSTKGISVLAGAAIVPGRERNEGPPLLPSTFRHSG